MNPDNTLVGNTPSTLDQKLSQYQNNPFYIAVLSLRLLFKRAKQLAWTILILTLLGLCFSAFKPRPSTAYNQPASQSNPSQLANNTSVPLEVWIMVAIFSLVFIIIGMFISFFISGIVDYSAAKLARGEKVTVREAAAQTWKHFGGYSWTMFVVSVKICLWSLLLIIPGYVMAVRYSLTGVIYFDKGTRGGAASSESAALTKGGWLTTNAAYTLLPLLTLGLLRGLCMPGTTAILYKQFSQLSDDQAKPKAHWLSWLTLFLSILITILIVAIITALIVITIFTLQEAKS